MVRDETLGLIYAIRRLGYGTVDWRVKEFLSECNHIRIEEIGPLVQNGAIVDAVLDYYENFPLECGELVRKLAQGSNAAESAISFFMYMPLVIDGKIREGLRPNPYKDFGVFTKEVPRYGRDC